MRSFLVFLLLLPLPALAWFGPGNEVECLERYAAKARVAALVSIAEQRCRDAFDQDVHRVARARALCEAERIPPLETVAAIRPISTACAAKHPAPACPAGNEFSFSRKRCVIGPCPFPQVRSADERACLAACPDGQVAANHTLQCIDPSAVKWD